MLQRMSRLSFFSKLWLLWQFQRMDRCQTSFAEAFTYKALAVAWQRVRTNDGSAGGDGVAIADFMRGERANLLALQRSLRCHRYLPGPLRRVRIPKKDGGLRELAIPCVADRIVQTAWLFALSPVIDPAMSAASFAYRPARSVRMALQVARRHLAEGRIWVVDADSGAFSTGCHMRSCSTSCRSG